MPPSPLPAAVGALTAPLSRRVALMVRWGVVKLVRAALATAEAQVAVHDDELLDRVKLLMPYGFSHHPLGGECLVLALGGSTSNPACLVLGRGHRPTDLAAGEVELYDDQGQRIILRRSGVEITTPFKVTITAPDGIRCETPMLEVTGEIKDRCDGAGSAMSAMRATYDAHTHRENDAHGQTNPTAQTMGGH